ncbi:site-specific recombinase, DNA invertase Pin (plasmid) [Deinococcus peraridilitoris DSM 19664]|uniref:Site-specific recombinase, DNA invertase Pin n=2 Tax=Deinococcus TaxID=1298 RepID=L0A9M6_DEIPD|nr:site-specific recombinase, DNA invertase Pin [Deinococcus peraridilitoris DSM 19664]
MSSFTPVVKIHERTIKNLYNPSMPTRRLTPGTPVITYIRVSDQKQGRSGLGLEAQHAAVQSFVRSYGLTVLDEYREIETGTNKRTRPQLQKALERTRQEGAVLLIAKLDRLARNVHFVSGLMESRVPFVAVDMPDVDDLTIHILAAVAEQEAKMISRRTKDALNAAKARGTRLGTPQNLTLEARRAGAQVRRQDAIAAYARVAGYIALMRRGGETLRGIARILNDEGHRTRQGKLWSAVQVRNVLLRSAPSTLDIR